MKFNLNSKYTQIAIYAVIVIVLSGFLLMSAQSIPNLKDMLDKVLTVLAPIVWGCGIAYILNPGVDFFRFRVFRKYSEKANTAKKKNIIRNISVFIVFILAVGLVTGLIFLIMPQVSTSLSGLVSKLDEYVNNLMVWINKVFGEYPAVMEIIQNPLVQIEQYLADSWADISKSVVDFGTTLGGNVIGILIGLKDFIIGLIFAVYILLSKDMLKSQAKRILFAFVKNNTAQKILDVTRRSNNIFIHYVTSVLLDAFIIGCATFIGTYLMGMPYPILITIIIAVTNIIPFFGPFLGAIPSVFLVLLSDDPIKALWLAIFILVLQQADGNIIKPVLYGGTMGLPAIWVLASIIIGGGLFGIGGMLLGVPVFSVIYMLSKEFLSARLSKKSLPTVGMIYNREDLGKYVDGYEYTDAEQKKDSDWLKSMNEQKKKRKFFRQGGRD